KSIAERSIEKRANAAHFAGSGAGIPAPCPALERPGDKAHIRARSRIGSVDLAYRLIIEAAHRGNSLFLVELQRQLGRFASREQVEIDFLVATAHLIIGPLPGDAETI